MKNITIFLRVEYKHLIRDFLNKKIAFERVDSKINAINVSRNVRESYI